jgi:hypothetical protein
LILVVVVMVNVEEAFPPAERLTLIGLMLQQYVKHGTSGVDRLTVPLNRLMLVRRIVDVIAEPGCTV